MSWRIGSVRYLNARPLIYGIENRVTLCEPARLADLLHEGRLDVGLVPIAEVLRHDQYDVVDGIAIAARGAVQSVYLAHREPVEKLRRVAVDPASRTSAWLVRVILRYGYHVTPEFYPGTEGMTLQDHEAMMLIGDQAIRHLARHDGLPVLDLGTAWMNLTNLPFVFAGWAVRHRTGSPEAGDPADGSAAAVAELARLLRDAKADGLGHLEEIVQAATEAPADFLRAYYTRHVWYDLGEAEKRGIRRFQQYLKEMGLVKATHEIRYVR